MNDRKRQRGMMALPSSGLALEQQPPARLHELEAQRQLELGAYLTGRANTLAITLLNLVATEAPMTA